MTPTTDTAPKHSRLSPSKAYQWTVCTASTIYARLNKHRLPKDTSSAAAIEGTKAHTCGEKMLLGQALPPWANKEMQRHARDYASYCRNVMGEDPIAWGVERRTPLTYLKSERGTVDFFCVTSTGIHLVDLKYGFGEVESHENKQMAIYACSLIEENIEAWGVTDATKITTTIFQPRLEGDPTPWKTTWKKLKKFVENEIAPRAKTILAHLDDPDIKLPRPSAGLVFAPSDKTCKFCACAAFCEARSELLMDDFKELTPTVSAPAEAPVAPPDWSNLSLERLVEIRLHRGLVDDWFDAIEEHLDKLINEGVKVPGLKRVLSKGGHRKWTDEVEAAKLLTQMNVPYDAIYSTSMCSPAQAEKLIHDKKAARAKKLFSLVTKPEGKPIVVAASDPRPEYVENVLEDFAGELEAPQQDWL